MDADKNMNAVLEQTLQEIHSTIWGRFIDENNIMLDYTDPEGKISLPRFHGANCITSVACGSVSTRLRLLTGARGLEGARPSSSLERQVLAEVQHPASSRSRTTEVGISCRGGRFVIDSPGV